MSITLLRKFIEFQTHLPVDRIPEKGKMDFEEVINKAGDKASVWYHFLRNKNKSEAKCKLCQKILKSGGGSTSSLQKHLKNVHKLSLESPTTSAQGGASTTKELPDPEMPKKKSKLTHFFESDANPSMEVMVSRMASMDGISLRTFIASQDLRYLFEKSGNKLPKTADTIRNKIIKESEKGKLEVISEIKAILSHEKKFSISFDEWTSNHNRRYIGLSLHSPDFARNAFRNLGLIRIHGSMNAAKCIQLIESKLNEYGISLTQDIVAQTTDGCSLMVAFGKSLQSYHQLCIAHAVQLAIVDVMYNRNKDIEEDVEAPQMILEQLDELGNYDYEDLPLSELSLRIRRGELSNETDDGENNNDEDDGAEFNNESPLASLPPQSFSYYHLIAKVRKVVKFFKKSPTKNDDVLQKYVKSDFGQEYSLLLDGKTRWSSMATMLGRFLKLKTSITKALIDLNIDIQFTDDDWRHIHELNNILDIIKTVVEALCRRDATLLTADISVKFAIKKLLEMNTNLSHKMVAALRKQYAKRRLVQASILQYLTNPEKYFDDIEIEDKTVFLRPTSDEMLRDIVNLIQRTKQSIPLDCTPDFSRHDDDDIQVSSLTNEEELNKEISQATASAPESISNDINTTVRVEMALFENGGQRQRGRYLSLAYHHLLSIPPTSVEPERIFSSAGIVCNRLRSSLSDKTLDALIFLRSFYLGKKKTNT
ncbi:hypothetical protein HF086_009258 [Spodoptera exigua]|uniref:BED-type domain-containing protein n=1 Tax=Spodoptera exigua TaxID=7107 RepID=A0A922SEC0_SPOEX|nr:hypothetical protein HF086_009258 [Spodoptera exigua]